MPACRAEPSTVMAAGSKPAWVCAVPLEAAVQRLAAKFAAVVTPPTVIYLRGDLGAGKTTFARAYIQALGFPGYVKSPSYGLLETYEAGGQKILHLDLYRIEDPEELEYLALRDLFDRQSVLLVEWPQHGGGNLPPPDVVLDFGETNEERFVSCSVISQHGRELAGKIELPT
jgi:tRNA threonylcarbamoyladenosine biosynthesis protein TsaE